MKKTMLPIAVLLALGAPLAAYAGDDVLDADSNEYSDVENDGAHAGGKDSSSNESLNGVGNISNNASHNADLFETLKDVNSDNSTTITEDGIIAYANELNQAIASTDSGLSVSGNAVVMEGAINDTAPSSLPVAVTATEVARSETNSMSGGFSSFGGVVNVGQNIGSTTAVAQSVVIQSNGDI